MKNLFSLFVILFSLNIVAQCDRVTALNDYNTNYVASSWNFNDLNWTGDIGACIPGTISSTVQNKFLQRINYFRRMCALSDNTVLLPSLNTAAQESALMQEAENSLSHCTGANGSPCDTWACTSPGAIMASQQGNLAWGNWNFSNPVTLYMQDSGAGNAAVGHRRWILFSGGEEWGNGVTPNRETMYVINNFGNPPNNTLDYIAYPPNGYIPAPLAFDRWSFGIRNAIFTNATVTMTDQNGVNVPLNVIYNSTVNFGDVSIVWEPIGIDTTNPEDVSYTVTVSGIGGAAPQSSYTYTTTIMQPTHPPACPTDTSWDEANCACIPDAVACDDNLVITDNPLASGTYQAAVSVTSIAGIPASNTVVFKAGDHINLFAPFEAKAGSDFHALIEACTFSRLMTDESLPPTKRAQVFEALEKGQKHFLGEAIAVTFGSDTPKPKKNLFQMLKKSNDPDCPDF